MNIYIYIPIIILVLIPFSKNRYVYWSIFVLLLAVEGGRAYTVGTDTEIYVRNFEHYKDTGLEIREYEYLFYLILKYIPTTEIFIFFTSFLSLFFVFCGAKRYSTKPLKIIFFYVLLYYYADSFSHIRSAIANSIIFFALYYLLRNKLKHYMAFVVVAIGFHYTAFVGFIFPLLRNINLSPLRALVILFLTYIIGLTIMPAIFPMFNSIGIYSSYLDDIGSGKMTVTRLLLNILCIYTIFFYKNNKSYRLYLNCFLMGIVVYNLMSFIPFVSRIALFCTIFQLVLFSFDNISVEKLKKVESILFTILTFSYALFYYVIMLMGNNNEIMPYMINVDLLNLIYQSSLMN